MNRLRLSAALVLGAALLAADPAPPGYAVAHRFPVPGDGFWDLVAVDEAGGRVFLTHSVEVQVVDGATGGLLGTIPGTPGVHGIALAPAAGKGFATCGRDSSIVVFDLASLRVVDRIPSTGRNPDAVVFEPVTGRILAFNGGSGNATVIDAATDRVVGTVALAGKPELAVADGRGAVFVNLEDRSMVQKVDAESLLAAPPWPLGPGEGPTGLALDAAHHRLFSACGNRVMVVMNADDGAIVATLPIGDHVDGAVFDPGLERAYAAGGDGTLTVIQETGPGRFRVLETVPTEAGARTVALNAKTHHLYLPAARFGETPAPTADHPRPRPPIVPGSFILLDVAPAG